MPLHATGSGKSKEYVYAVLARDYYAGPDWCCTCLHLDSQLHIYGHKDINIAISRLNNKAYCCPIKEKAPKEQLQYLLSQRMLLTPALHDVVAEMEETYNARLENNCNITGVITPTAISCDATPSATEDDKASTDNISCEATPSANKDDEETPTGMKMTNAVKDGTFIETKKALTKKRKRRTTARVHSTAADDISCAATPSANEHEKANPTRIRRTKAVKERTVRETQKALKKRKRRTPARVNNPAADDISCGATPSANDHDKASTTKETSSAHPKTETYNQDWLTTVQVMGCDPADYYEWEGQWYYQRDEQYWGQDWLTHKSLKPNNNKSEAYEPSTEDPQTETYNSGDYYEWEGQWYKWDEQEWGQDWLTQKSLKPNNNKSETYEPSTADTQTETYNPADYFEWEGQWYKWDEQERRQKCLTKNSTSPNKKGPVNTRVRNWMLAMRRNMKPEVKEAALRPFTITRERLHEVRSHSL